MRIYGMRKKVGQVVLLLLSRGSKHRVGSGWWIGRETGCGVAGGFYKGLGPFWASLS